MKKLQFAIVLFVALVSSRVLHAQPIFTSPAFDDHCYFPQFSNTSQTQVRYGEGKGDYLGLDLTGLPPAPGEKVNRMFFIGEPQSPVFLTNVRKTIPFSVNNLSIQGVNTLPSFNLEGLKVIGEGHFHRSDLTDLLVQEYPGDVYSIYWSDENGLYDSTRRTWLRVSYSLDSVPIHPAYLESQPYSAYLTSDTVEDIVFGGYVAGDLAGDTYSLFFLLYRGGEHLFAQGSMAAEDSSIKIISGSGDSVFSPSTHPYDPTTYLTAQGDWRGVDRQDLIALGNGGEFYYKNDPPFSLSKFRDAMLHDTLCADWQHKTILGGDCFSIQAFPKADGDHSQDFIMSGGTGGAMRIFKGGPNFGSKRLDADSADFVIAYPSDYDPTFNNLSYFGNFYDCGDMTGTGNHVLFTQLFDLQGDFLNLFYVLGYALDDKIDMFQSYYGADAVVDTLNANGDNLQDIILGMPGIIDPSHPADSGAGMLEVIYGTKSIPVTLNPKFAVKEENNATEPGIQIYPNPFSQSTVITWLPTGEGIVSIRLRNVLGQSVFEEERPSLGSLESFRLNVPRLPAGDYILELIQGASTQRAKVIVRE